MANITDVQLERYKKLEKDITILKNAEYNNAQLYSENLEEERKKTNKFKIAAIAFGLLALLGVISTYYYFNTKIQEQNVALQKIKKETVSAENEMTLAEQDVYAVQIGAFVKRDLSLYSDGFINFKEIKAEGFNKYALGNFASLDEAKAFRSELVALGIKDAFIGFYQNGVRQRIEEVEE